MASERLWCSLLRPAALALLFSPLSRGFSIYKRQTKTETKMTTGFNSKQQKRRNRDTEREREREREVVKIIKVLIRDVVRKLWNGSSLLLKIKDVKSNVWTFNFGFCVGLRWLVESCSHELPLITLFEWQCLLSSNCDMKKPRFCCKVCVRFVCKNNGH